MNKTAGNARPSARGAVDQIDEAAERARFEAKFPNPYGLNRAEHPSLWGSSADKNSHPGYQP